ncbi:MAG: hypothetical protein HYU51_16420, partial [Candidatus Rokubacteria bacterium]|nr:hypothetical protein [Candidatus Rokubacteria bacterium]
MKNGTCLAPVALTTIEPVRNPSGSVLWKRVPGFMPWLGHYAPGLTNRELRLAI